MRPDQIDELVRAQAPFVFDRMFSAVEKVKERMERVCKALSTANVPYAIVGGNAVAAWVATKDEGAVRNTRDVDILLNPTDIDLAEEALSKVGFQKTKVMEVTMFLDGPDGRASEAVHVIWAGQKVKQHDTVAVADVSESRDINGKQIVDLIGLLRMKLIAFRDKDRVHIRDMMGVGLIDQSWLNELEPELAERLQTLLDDPDG